MTDDDPQLRQSRNDRAVSPVIGVILMVAVTVVLAAVIGTFVLDLGGLVAARPPTASVSATADATTETITVYHRGGDRLDASRTRIVLRNESADAVTVWQPAADRAILAVGESAQVNVTTGAIDWAGSDVYAEENGEIDGLAPRVGYTVQLVDVPTGRMVAETRVLV